MRLAIFLLLVGCLQVSASTNAQKISIEATNLPLEKIFNIIKDESGYMFVYNPDLIKNASKISLHFKNESLKNVLDKCLEKIPITYEIKYNTIILKKNEETETENIRLRKESFQQTDITGTIKDKSGRPLSSVSVMLVGHPNKGTLSDIQGQFSIQASENDSLKFISVGYIDQTVFIGHNKILNIIMESSNDSLNDIVVVGYGTQKKDALTSAVSSIKGKDIVTTKNENVENMLTGKVAGLQVVQNSAEPGDFSNNISIRGLGNPLIVVDGIEMPNFNVTGGTGDNDIGTSNILSRLDPNDIESISVLKDASAAVYGVKAANGVILITTKKGQSGTLQLSYSGSIGSQVPSGLPAPVDALQYMTLSNQLSMHNANGGVIVYTPADFTAYTDGTKKSTDWYDAVFKKSALQQQHNITATGGSANTQYFLSVGYTDQNGFLQSGDLNYKRYNVRSNVSSKISKNLTVNLNMSAIMDQKNSPAESFWYTTRETWRELPTQTIYANNNPQFLTNGIVDAGNPVAYMDDNIVGYSVQNNQFFNGSLSVEYKIPFVEGLSIKGLYSYNTQIQDNKTYQKAFNLYTYDASTQAYTANLNNSPSYVQRQYYKYPQNTDQFSINYSHSFKNVHNVTAMLLYEGNEQTADNFAAYRQVSLPVDQIIAGNSLNQNATQDVNGLYQYATNSVVGRVTYDYKGTYLAEFSFRNDESSKFPPSHRAGFFPSASVGWRMSDEKFWKNSVFSFIDNFKIRASYGVLGDDGSLYYQFLTGYNYPATGASNQLPSGSVFGSTFINSVQSTGLANPNITWSTSHTFDVGADLDAWKGLFSITYDFFIRNRKGLYATPALEVPDVLGAPLPQENLNGDRTQGVDFTIDHKNNIGKFNYDIKGTFSFARTMNTSYAESKHGNSYLDWLNNQGNRDQGIQWGYGASGQYNSYQQILNSPTYVSRGTVVGDYIYQDWNGDGQIDGNDIHPIAYGDNPNGGRGATPWITYGLTVAGSYKNFDINLLFQGVADYDISYVEQLNIPLWGGGSALTQFLNDWHPQDPNADPYNPNTVWVPGSFAYTGTTAMTNSSFNFHNASYLRLKSVEIGYTLPKSILDHIGLHSVRVFVNAYNLFTITGIKYVDPEHPTGLYGYLYPLDKLYNAGINVNF